MHTHVHTGTYTSSAANAKHKQGSLSEAERTAKAWLKVCKITELPAAARTKVCEHQGKLSRSLPAYHFASDG